MLAFEPLERLLPRLLRHVPVHRHRRHVLSAQLPGRTVAYRIAQVRPRVSGIIKMPKGASARSALEDALLERHGLTR